MIYKCINTYINHNKQSSKCTTESLKKNQGADVSTADIIYLLIYQYYDFKWQWKTKEVMEETPSNHVMSADMG